MGEKKGTMINMMVLMDNRAEFPALQRGSTSLIGRKGTSILYQSFVNRAYYVNFSMQRN